MTRINTVRNIAGPRDSVAWGKNIPNKIRSINASPLIFAAVLIVCSLAVGCSSSKSSNDQPKPVSSNSQISMTQAPSPIAPVAAPAIAENKPAAKKVVHRKPATVNYTDKTYGVTFEYPRRYAIETGDAANDLVSSSTMPMNFVAPGGVALAAVELPETGFANTDFSSAFFDVSVHKTLTADQCNEFAMPQPKAQAPGLANDTAPVQNSNSAGTQAASTVAAGDAQSAPSQTAQSTPAPAESPAPAASPNAAATQPAVQDSNSQASNAQGSKLMLGDLELLGTEAVTGEGTRQSDSKYFHVYQNGACYEFALNVTTDASDGGLVKHVDRDKVFSRLEQILGTVKINPVMPDATAETPAAPAAPAQ